jgi:hypothetical protein
LLIAQKNTFMNGLKISQLTAFGLLLFAMGSLPYGYYQFLRIAITIIASVNAFHFFKSENKIPFILFLAIAILYNPILPIYLTKSIWIPINLISGLFFGAIAIKKNFIDESGKEV